MTEANARQLLSQPLAWPLGKRVHRQQRFSRQLVPLDRKLRKLERFFVFVPHDFQPDRLTAWVATHSTFKETYARGFRVKSDNEIPGETLEAIQHNHMPQFNLRNIGRAERDVDLNDPLPLERQDGLGGKLGVELEEVRQARVPRPQMAEVWSVRMMGKVRASFRRILLEDPWELRLGPDANSGHEGLAYKFVVEGTHPDDLPDAWWGPQPIAMPEKWQGPPRGMESETDDGDRPDEMFADMREMTR